MRRLEMYLSDYQISSLKFTDVKFTVTNEVRARKKLVIFDSQEQFDKAYRMIV